MYSASVILETLMLCGIMDEKLVGINAPAPRSTCAHTATKNRGTGKILMTFCETQKYKVGSATAIKLDTNLHTDKEGNPEKASQKAS